MRHHWKTDLQRELSWFLIAYLLMLLGVLLAVHALQPGWERPGRAMQSQAYEGRQPTVNQAVATRTGSRFRSSVPSPQ